VSIAKSHCAAGALSCVNESVKAMYRLVLAAALLAGGAIGAGTAYEAQSAWQKLAWIEQGHPRPGSRITFTPGELNAWARDEAKLYAPQGARNLRLSLGTGRATGYADIDFVRLRQASTGEAPGWIMRNLFAGERPVVVTARFESRNGRARVDVERVEVSGVPIEGRVLDFLISDYLRPMFPAAKVGEWFALDYGVERFTVSLAGVTVLIGR